MPSSAAGCRSPPRPRSARGGMSTSGRAGTPTPRLRSTPRSGTAFAGWSARPMKPALTARTIRWGPHGRSLRARWGVPTRSGPTSPWRSRTRPSTSTTGPRRGPPVPLRGPGGSWSLRPARGAARRRAVRRLRIPSPQPTGAGRQPGERRPRPPRQGRRLALDLVATPDNRPTGGQQTAPGTGGRCPWRRTTRAIAIGGGAAPTWGRPPASARTCTRRPTSPRGSSSERTPWPPVGASGSGQSCRRPQGSRRCPGLVSRPGRLSAGYHTRSSQARRRRRSGFWRARNARPPACAGTRTTAPVLNVAGLLPP